MDTTKKNTMYKVIMRTQNGMPVMVNSGRRERLLNFKFSTEDI